jgi:methionyl-tRNA synthetase
MPQLLVHGWWNLGGAKMSKSTGNIIDPFVLIDKYGAEALRYYLMSDIAMGKDADFSEDRLVTRYNTDLANSLGNLLNRTLNMVWQYGDGVLRLSHHDEESFEWLRAFISVIVEMNYPNLFAAYDPSTALELVLGRVAEADLGHELQDRKIAEEKLEDYRVLGIVPKCNFLVDHIAPWKLAKDPTRTAQLSALLYHLVESLRIIAILISPVLPGAAHGIFDQLNWKMEFGGKEERFSLADTEWGRLPDGHVVGKPVPLFPRIEIDGGV